ncbi:MAG: response regulator [Candidatus Hermodarchaeota archaeon]
MRHKKPILFVEDECVDAMMAKRALREINIPNRLIIARNGEDALSFLRKADEKPCIILLDLNMPRMNGLEFLKVIKQDERLKRIPVIVLTGSNENQDVAESFIQGVAGYMVKPLDYSQYLTIMRIIMNYWSYSELPRDIEDPPEAQIPIIEPLKIHE